MEDLGENLLYHRPNQRGHGPQVETNWVSTRSSSRAGQFVAATLVVHQPAEESAPTNHAPVVFARHACERALVASARPGPASTEEKP